MSLASPPTRADVIIAGAGAAGLAAAIFARRHAPAASVLLLEGARKPGAKILVSGGGRCNVTNRVVTEADFWGGSPRIVRRVLNAFPASAAVEFFERLGVSLHEEAGGKLFPDSGRARDVLDALLREVDAAGARLVSECRVQDVQRDAAGFRVLTSRGTFESARVVLATGGESLPKSGSDGAGFAFARRLGHTIVPTTPALVPLVLDPGEPSSIHAKLSGVSHEVELAVWTAGRIAIRPRGSMLWTHFGVSGPVALNASRHWLRAQLEQRPARITASFCPGMTFDRLDQRLIDMGVSNPKASVTAALSAYVPASVAAAVTRAVEVGATGQLAHLTKAERRRIAHALLEWPLAVAGSRGYNYAEATAGGVTLTEVNPATLESRVCPGLYLVGEILDVDGRIGGFNFQWAWSTAYVAGQALTRPKTTPPPIYK